MFQAVQTKPIQESLEGSSDEEHANTPLGDDNGAALGLVLLPRATRADDGWLREFDEASAVAKQQGKDILIDFSGTDWCLPCRRLWNQTLSQPEFIKHANSHFVLLEVDNLATKTMPKGRKERYDALQTRYGIQSFPTVVLASAEGLPYAATGLLEEINNPTAYWQHLQPLYERGQNFKAVLDAAGGAGALTNASTIVDVLSEVRPDFVARFYSDRLNQLRKQTSADASAYLAFVAFRTGLSSLERKLHEEFLESYDKWAAGQPMDSRWAKDFSPRDVDLLIEKHQPKGVSLQEALLARVFLEIDAGQWDQALATVAAIASNESPPSRFEQANFLQISMRSSAQLRDRIRATRAMGDHPLGQLRTLYKVVHDDLECVAPTSCCNHSFTLQMHQLVAGAAYGEMLLDSTAHLQGEARAKAIGEGLQDIELWANGSIGRIVHEVMPSLVGKDAAKKYLPPYYADWLDD